MHCDAATQLANWITAKTSSCTVNGQGVHKWKCTAWERFNQLHLYRGPPLAHLTFNCLQITETFTVPGKGSHFV